MSTTASVSWDHTRRNARPMMRMCYN